MPDVFLLANLGFEGRHAGALSLENATEDFALGGAVLPEIGRSKIGSIGDHVDGGLGVDTVASGAIAQIDASSLGDRLLGIRKWVLEFLRVRDAEWLFLFFVREGNGSRGDEHTGAEQHWKNDGLSQLYK